MSEELKIKIPVLVDDSEAAKGRFQRSITQLAKNMTGANAPKIEITVSKINGKEAINAFKKEIEAVIGSVGKIPASSSGSEKSSDTKSSYWNEQFKKSISAMTATNIDLKPLNDYYQKLETETKRIAEKAKKFYAAGSSTTKLENFDTDIEKYRKLGLGVADAEESLNKLRTSQQNFQSAIQSGDNASIAESYKEMEVQIQKVGNSLSNVSKQRASDTSLNKEQAHLHNLILEMQSYEKLNNKFRSNSGLSFEFNDLSSKMQSAFKAGDFSAVDEYAERWRSLQGNIKSASLEGQNFGAKLKQQFDKLGVYLSASAVIMQLTKAIKDTVKAVIELDGVVTDLQIATGGTRKETQELLKTYSAMGKELGATTVDVGKAADAWLRMGYSAEQTTTLIKNSMMLSKLGQIDSAEATKNLTTAMKGYNISVEDSISVVDKLSAIDMKAAVSAGYIATAMAETATSARLAGVDINKLAGYIAAIGETTGDGAESVGNFAKTLFARMGNIKAGNLIDPESSESLSDVEATLSGLSIKLRSSKGEFRNFGEILDEVSRNWSNYGTVQQRAIAVAFSGTRQQEKFLTLMEKYGEATDYATVATNSAGTALDKYENSYLKSAEAAQARFTAQFEQMSTTFWNSDLIVGTIDTGAGAIGILTNIIELMGSIPALAATVGGAISAFSGKGLVGLSAANNPDSWSGQKLSLGLSGLFDKITDSDIEVFERVNQAIKKNATATAALDAEYGNLSKAGKTLGKSIRDSGGAFDSAAISAKTLSVSSKVAAVGMKALSVAANMALSAGIGLAIGFIVEQIVNLVNAQQNAINTANELTDTYRSASSEIGDNVKTVELLSKEFEKLSTGVDRNGKNVSLTAEEYERYRDIVNELVEMNPSLVKGYGDEHEALVDNNTVITEAIRLQKELNSQKRKEYLLAGEEVIAGVRGEVKSSEQKLDDIRPIWEDDSASGFVLANQMKGVRNRTGTTAEFDEMNSVINKFGLDFKKISEGNVDELRKIIPVQDQLIESLAKYYNLSDSQQQELRGTIGLIDLELNKIDSAYSKISSYLTEWASDSQNSSWYGKIDTGYLDEFQSALTDISKNSDMSLSEMQVATKKLGKSFVAMQSEIPTDEFEMLGERYSRGSISAEEYNSSVRSLLEILTALKSKYPELALVIDSVAKQWTDFKKDVETTTIEPNIDNMIDGVSKIEESFSVLRTALKESLDPDVDVSNSTLSNLKKSFGELGDTYEDAIAVIANSKSSYEDVKTAVESLASVYMSSAAFIKQVNDGNKEAMVLGLQNIGVTNAEEVASLALAAAKIEDAIATEVVNEQTGNLTASTEDLILKLYGLTSGTEEAAKMLALWELKKQIASNGNLARYLSVDGSGFLALANVAGIAGTALAKYAEISRKIELTKQQGGSSAVGQGVRLLQEELNGLQAEIESEINSALNRTYKFNIDLKPASSSSTTKPTKEVEEYIAAIDELYEAEKRLADIQRDRATLQAKADLAGNNDKRVEQLKQIAQYYEDEQAQLHRINNLRDKMVQNDVDKLRGQEFEVSYDPATNELLIHNMERINALTATSKGSYSTLQEATNALRKEYEELIQSTISLNKENQEGSNQYFELAKSIKATNKEIADLTLSSYDEFISRADNFDWWGDMDTSKVEWLEKKLVAINSLRKQGYLDELEYKQLVEETAKSIYDIKNQAIQDTIDLTMELIKQEKQNEIDVLEGQKKTYADIVDAKKEALALTKEEYGYQKTLTDKLAEIAKIQNKLNELAPDDSRESIAEKKKLAEELAKLQGDLDETQADHTYEEQVKALDKSQEAFEKSKDEEIKLIEETINTTQKLYDLAIKRIDAGWDTLYTDLIAYNTDYGDGISGEDSITSAWEEAKKAAEEYGDIVRANAGIKTEHAPNSGGNGAVGDDPLNSPQVQEIVSEMKIRRDQWHSGMSKKEQDDLAAENDMDAQRLRNLGINVIRGHDGVWYLDKVGGQKLFGEYHTGGIVGKGRFKPNERLALVEDDEAIFDKKSTQGIFKKLEWASFVKEKLGSSFSGNFDKSLFSASPQNMLASMKGAPTPNSSFSPTIEVNINGPISKDLDPKKFGKLAGESALEVLKTALGGGQSGTSKSPIFST